MFLIMVIVKLVIVVLALCPIMFLSTLVLKSEKKQAIRSRAFQENFVELEFERE